MKKLRRGIELNGEIHNNNKATVSSDFCKFLSVLSSIEKEDQKEPIRMHELDNRYYPCDGTKRLASLILLGIDRVKIYIDTQDNIWLRNNSLSGKYFSYLSEDVKIDFLSYRERLKARIKNRYLIADNLRLYQPQKGHYRFYQAYKKLGIEGQRPTIYRYHKYKIDEVITKKSIVLDVGCNIGCFCFHLSERIKKAHGIDNNYEHIKTANMIKSLIKADNCEFFLSNISSFPRQKIYDLVLSLAAHPNSLSGFNMMLDFYLSCIKPGGYLLMESRNYENGKLFPKIINALLSKGFKTKWADSIQDTNSEGILNEKRDFCMIRREENL